MDGVRIGFKNVHYAVLQSDNSTGATYDTPVNLSGGINGKITPKVNSTTLFADDGPQDVATSLGEIDVELEVASIPVADQAKLLGGSVDTSGVLIEKVSDQAPYVALGFQADKSNGASRFVWLYKGRFEQPEFDYSTKTDSPAFQSPTIKGTFVRRDFDDAWRAIGDTDNPTFSGNATWFDTVYQSS